MLAIKETNNFALVLTNYFIDKKIVNTIETHFFTLDKYKHSILDEEYKESQTFVKN